MRLIDADALINKIKSDLSYMDYEWSMYADGFIEDMASAPTIEAVYICNRKRCDNCSPECDFTRDINYAGTTDKVFVIDNAPTIEIVRCKNCKHAKECEQMVVFENGKYITAGYKLDFCSYGARMTDSEKPNNCKVKNYCDDCLYTDTCDSKEFFWACTQKATRGAKTEPTGYNLSPVKDEPQTETPRCSVNGTPFDECGFCEYFNCDTCKCEADVPQTERSE